MFYLKAKQIDFNPGHNKSIFLNSKSTIDEGIQPGQRVQIKTPLSDKSYIVTVEQTEKLVLHHEIGISTQAWAELGLHEGDLITVEMLPQPQSLDAIRKKLLRNKLNYKEIKSVLDDIVSGRLGEVEATYFAACGFNPGFDDELYFLTKAMAASGETIKWPHKMVVDKHSIGGLAGKGITPIVISIIASRGLIIPNTSTRAITAPAGTTDVMEVFCDVEFTKEEINDLIEQNNACLVWGGGLDLAPADEALIEIEKPLGIELYDKFIVSILAKKVAMGLTHYILDIPSGPDTKVQDPEDVKIIQRKFEELSEKFGIKVKVLNRQPLGPDGRGIGANLEARDILEIFQQTSTRYTPLEEVSVWMAGELLELAGEAKEGKGYDMAMKELKSGKAYAKFKAIIKSQRGDPDIRIEDIPLGEIKKEIVAKAAGKVVDIENHVIKEIAHALGCPNIKQAGIYLHKQIGESYQKGDVLYTLYATSESRMELALKILELKQMLVN